jgi:hypothetical protein
LKSTDIQTVFSASNAIVQPSAITGLVFNPNTFFNTVCAIKDQNINVRQRQTFNSVQFSTDIDTLDITYTSIPDTYTVVPDVGLLCTSENTPDCSEVTRVLVLPTTGPDIQAFYIGVTPSCTAGQTLTLDVTSAVDNSVTTYIVDCNDISSEQRFVGIVQSDAIAAVTITSTFDDYAIFAVGLGQTLCNGTRRPTRAPTRRPPTGSKGSKGSKSMSMSRIGSMSMSRIGSMSMSRSMMRSKPRDNRKE